MRLFRQKSKPGSVIQRFGRWQNGEPQVLLDNQTWLHLGKPNWVDIEFENGSEQRWEDEGGYIS